MSANAFKPPAGAPLGLPIFIRAFAEEIEDEPVSSTDEPTKPQRAKAKRLAGPGLWTLCFDTETTTDPTQRFRLGFYQLREGARLDEERLIYDPDSLTTEEIATIAAFGRERGLEEPITLDAFRSEVLIKRGFEIGATIVTFNGPFDFARVALNASAARATKWRRKMHGAFTFTISESDYDPHIQIKSLNPRAAMVELTAPRKQVTSRSRRKREDHTPAYRGYFVDVKSLAGALLSGTFSLASLTATLDTPTKKARNEDHGQTVSFDYLDYARSDVQATWECYRALAAKYAGYGLDAPITSIISEASIGKAALSTMGIKPWKEVQPGGFDKGLISLILSTYFGGRTEVRIRREMTRVAHTDFTSMYPTVCTLEGLWPFVIGEGFTSRDATSETRAFLDAATAEMFQDQSTWRRLAVLVRVQPDDNLFPIRAEYPAQKHATIGLNYLTYDGSLWLTLADCIAAKLLSGRTPQVEEAIAFDPGPPQRGLKPIRLMGGEPIDPYRQDLYRELICRRERLKAAKVSRSDEERDRIEEERQAVKITANSTSYGIFVQVNVTAEPRGAKVRVYRPDGSHFDRHMKKVEEPGPWFHPLVATLITGAARLMLALAERKVLDAGLDWAFCDTDSLAIAQPDDMEEGDFLRRARGVVDWFIPLNPYGLHEPILKLEDVNFEPDDAGNIQPLYCWAVSSKRYALFNIAANGVPVIRKASAHGLGHLLPPYPDRHAPSHIPPPLKSVIGGKEKLQRWHFDLWFVMLRAVLAGEPDEVRFSHHPALRGPTVSRYTATSPDILAWLKCWNGEKAYAERVKPFGFLHLLHVSRLPRHPDATPDPVDGSSAGDALFPVAPFDTDLQASIAKAFDRKSGAPIDLARLQTYRDALLQYPWRSEGKFRNGSGYDRGRTERRHIRATEITLIGKEADRWEEEYAIGSGLGDPTVNYGTDPAVALDAFNQLRRAMAAVGKAELARVTGVGRAALAKIERGEQARTEVQPGRIVAAVATVLARKSEAEKVALARRAQLRTVVLQEGGIRAAARKLNIDPSNLSKRLRTGDL